MQVAVDLHVHERLGSGDSRTAAWQMADVMADRYGPAAAIGFVGHDTIVETSGGPTLTFDGVEHEPNPGRWLHILEFPDHDFRVLAHPAKTFADPLEGARRVIDERDLDAVEKWNWANGGLQYEGSLPVPEIASSDAHSPIAVGLNHMLVDVDTVSEDAVMREVKAGRFDVVTQRLRGRRLFHRLEKTTALTVERLRRAPLNPMAWRSAHAPQR